MSETVRVTPGTEKEGFEPSDSVLPGVEREVTASRPPPRERELWVPVDRLQPILDRYTGKRQHLPDARRVNLIMAGGQQFVSLTVVDRILIDMDLDHWLRLDRDQGGLADIYQDGMQYGRPSVPPPAVRKHETSEEALEAERTRWREAKRRRAAVKVSVVCPSCGVPRLLTPRYAALNPDVSCRACSDGAVAAVWAAEREKAA